MNDECNCHTWQRFLWLPDIGNVISVELLVPHPPDGCRCRRSKEVAKGGSWGSAILNKLFEILFYLNLFHYPSMHSSWTPDHLQARMLKPSCDDKLWHGVTVLRAWPHLYTEADLVFFLGNCLHGLGMVTLSLSWLSRESELKEWIRFDVTFNNWMDCKIFLADFIAIYPACIISNLVDQFQCQEKNKLNF